MFKINSILPVLRVADLDRSVRFYEDTLGFAVAWRAPNDGGGENCMLSTGSVSLLLSTGPHLGDTPRFTGTLYFDGSGVEQLYEAIKDRVTLVWPLGVMKYGSREFGFRDPDGYLLAASESTDGV
jgi:catechol 2,3-dioxygenase-like lactoylglutathione lyase family enzyme